MTTVQKEDPAAAPAAAFRRPPGPDAGNPLSNTRALPRRSTANNSDQDPVAPGAGAEFRGHRTSRPSWGPLTHFFERYTGPTGPAALEQVAERVRAGMDYREVARKCGFPSIGAGDCPWDHGVPDMDACWRYEIEEPTIVQQGDFIGAIPPANAVIVHVVISGHVVQKVERLLSSAPEDRPIRHGEQASFDFDSIIAGVAFSPDGSTVAAGDTKGAVHLWDVRGRRERSALRVPGAGDSASSRGWLRSVAFTPDGQTLAAAGLYDGTVRLWDVGTGRPKERPSRCCPWLNSHGMDRVGRWRSPRTARRSPRPAMAPDVGLWDIGRGARLAAGSFLQGPSRRLRPMAGRCFEDSAGDGPPLGRRGRRPRDRFGTRRPCWPGLLLATAGSWPVRRSDGTEASVRLRPDDRPMARGVRRGLEHRHDRPGIFAR